MTDDRPWICTYTGKRHYITDPDLSSIDIDSIAHALSLICRFGGHTRVFYGVGEHSVRVSRLLQKRFPDCKLLSLYGLLHDQQEHVLNDVVRPLKQTMPQYQELESKTEKVCYEALDLALPNDDQHHWIKWADNVMLATERRDLLNHQDHQWNLDEEPDDEIIHPWPPERAEREFLWEYNRLRAML